MGIVIHTQPTFSPMLYLCPSLPSHILCNLSLFPLARIISHSFRLSLSNVRKSTRTISPCIKLSPPPPPPQSITRDYTILPRPSNITEARAPLDTPPLRVRAFKMTHQTPQSLRPPPVTVLIDHVQGVVWEPLVDCIGAIQMIASARLLVM